MDLGFIDPPYFLPTARILAHHLAIANSNTLPHRNLYTHDSVVSTHTHTHAFPHQHTSPTNS